MYSSSLKCKQHKSNNCEFVQMNNTQGFLLICQECIDASNGTIKPIDCIPISRIVETNTLANLSQNAPFINHTELNDHLIDDISSFSIDTANAQIKDFFKELKKSFKDKINELLHQSQESMDSLKNLQGTILQQFQDISSIERLKDIIQSNSTELESELNGFKEKYLSEVNGLIAEIKRFKQQRSSIEVLQQPQKIIDNIFKEIQFFELFNLKQVQSSSISQYLVNIPVSTETNETKQTTSNKSINSIINQITILPSKPRGFISDTPIIQRLRDESIKITDTYQCFIEQKLIPTKKYILTLKTQTDPKDPSPYFQFGLMLYSKRLDKKLGNQNMCYSERTDSYGFSKMIKGKQLHLGHDYDSNDDNYWEFNDSRRFEVRIDLSQKFMRIASLPDYDLIAEINDKSKIKNDTDYIFAFFTASSRKNSFILEDIEVVNEFDGKM